MSYTLSGNTSGIYVTFAVVKRIVLSTTRTVVNYVFADNTDLQLDEGKSIDQIVIYGNDNDTFPNVFPVSTIYGRMNIVNTFMDDKEEITLSGMDDTNLNTEYIINDFSFNQEEGIPSSYDFEITLEGLHD